jgi:hypothetical protein
MKVFIKSEISQHPDYSKLVDVMHPIHKKRDAASFGLLSLDKGRHFQYVIGDRIFPFVAENTYHIEDIDWSDLNQFTSKLSLTQADVERIKPFDNSSFWKYATKHIVDIDSKFIRVNVGKINFSVDEISRNVTKPYRGGFDGPSDLCLSQSQTLCWSKALIKEFEHLWNWEFLSCNTSIPWDSDLVDEFKDKIDFIALSNNTNVKWTVELLQTYTNKLNWVELSGNPSLPWSYNLIKIFESNWVWKPESKVLSSHQTYLRGEAYSYLKPKSISHNYGIRWTEEFEEYIQKIDAWSVAANAFMSQPFIALVAEKLNEKRVIYTYWKKYLSYDCYPSELWEEELNGWELITKNLSKFYTE